MRFRGLPVFRVFFGFLLFRRRYQTGRAGRRLNLLLMLNLTRSVGQTSGRGITQLANMSIDPNLSNSQPAYVEAFLEERQSWTCQPFPCYRSAVFRAPVVDMSTVPVLPIRGCCCCCCCCCRRCCFPLNFRDVPFSCVFLSTLFLPAHTTDLPVGQISGSEMIKLVLRGRACSILARQQ